MTNDSREAVRRPVHVRPAPPPDEFFCIYSYAGESGPPCGWRGPAGEVRGDAAAGPRRCPRCGRTTLLEIPPPLAAD